MPTAIARVATSRAARYLAQLSDHAGHLTAAARHSGTEGVIDFGWARCTLTATDAELILRGESDDPDGLSRLRECVTRTLERIGRRDRLVVAWSETSSRISSATALVGDLMTPEGRANPYPY